MNLLPAYHTGGVEFFRYPDQKSLDVQGYFNCIKILTPLLTSQDFQSFTPGFYINYVTVPDDNLNSLRITYYTIEPVKTQEAIKKFVNQNSGQIALCDSQWTSRTMTSRPMDEIGDEELKFRNFLNINTKIFLDLLENYGQDPLQKLVYEYRYVHLPQRIAPETIFEPILTKYSIFFQELKKQSLDKDYWYGLVHLFHNRDFGLHFLVNMAAIQESLYDPRFFDSNWCLR